MIYSEACEAQGMTLADLIKKQADDWPSGKTLTISYLEEIPAGTYKTVRATSDNVLTVYNDTTYAYSWQIYYGDDPVGEAQTREAESTVTLRYSEGWSVRTADAKYVLIEFVAPNYYTRFGLSRVVLPSSASTYLPAIWDRVCTRVNERYWKRYLAGETLEEWQVLLQTMTDELAPRYERAFRMYAANSEASEADILATMRTDYGADGLTDEHTQTAKGTSKTTVRDTPDGQINDTSDYAGTVTDGETDAGTTKSTRKGTVTVTQTGSDGVLGRVNENIRLWRDLETDLVKEYANAFMSFIWA